MPGVAPPHARTAGRVGLLVVTGVLAATAVALLARLHWTADLASHFPLQYAGAALLGAAALAWGRRPAWTALALLLAGYNGYRAFEPLPATPAPTVRSQPFRLLVANVFYGNREHARVLELVRDTQPDAVVFVEVTAEWRAALRPLEEQLPHASPVVGGRHGVLILSRWPIVSAQALQAVPGGDAFLDARLDVAGRRVTVLAVHASWPLGAGNWALRNRQLESIARLAPSAVKPLIVAGDLNTTPHSPHFDVLLETGGLRSAAADRRWAPTWPMFFLPGGIQIDHVLLSGNVAVRAFRTGPAVGSDHLPIVADLVL